MKSPPSLGEETVPLIKILLLPKLVVKKEVRCRTILLRETLPVLVPLTEAKIVIVVLPRVPFLVELEKEDNGMILVLVKRPVTLMTCPLTYLKAVRILEM